MYKQEQKRLYKQNKSEKKVNSNEKGPHFAVIIR